MELDVSGHLAGHVLDGRHPPQHLLHGERQQRSGRRTALASWSGWREQLVHAAADDVAGGLVPADQDQQRLIDDDASSSRSPSISAWTSVPIRSSDCVVPPALLGHGRDVLGVLHGSQGGPVHGRGVGRPQCLQHVVGPPQEVVAVLGGHPEHVADHDHGQRGGDVPDEVGATRLADPIDDGVADRSDAVLALADARGVNPSLTSRRRRTCSGASVSIIIGRASLSGRIPPALEKVSGSLEISLMSAYRVIPHTPDGLVEVGRRVLAHPGERREGVAAVERAVGQADGQLGGRSWSWRSFVVVRPRRVGGICQSVVR